MNADYQDTLDASLTIAKAVGKESAMEKKLAEHKQKLDELKQKFGSRKQSILLLGNTNEEITVRDENFFTSQLLTKIGYTYGVGDSGKGDAENGESVNIKMTLEQLLEKDPDVIVLMTEKKIKSMKTGKDRSKKILFGKSSAQSKTARFMKPTDSPGRSDAALTEQMS